MAQRAELRLSLDLYDTYGNLVAGSPPLDIRVTPASGLPKTEVISLTGSAFTALSPPSGALGVLIIPESAVSLSLKNVTGDATGIVTVPATANGIPILLPLGTAPGLGFLNNGATATVKVIWF